MKKILLLITFSFTLNSCGTIVQLIAPGKPYTAYAGSKYDLEMAGKWGLPIIDLPLSFLLDTALLPYVWSQE
ncbi:YceK/YidQ family lipoprotein [Cricetibacter osteomyelitidis]|uniref:YceK/YidQ family lipoprotein n=1 Tax=Cricetibacter osteomyelitidis TaxID=1521931 RepID=UPI001049714B|nr:YceK/YidQ family lipoprotein [Cricetibacter osteomyelitidis]